MFTIREVREPPITILLAEDDLDMRDIIQDLLETIGCEVIPARTGRQALEFLFADSELPPDIVILDLMMPFVTGWQVLTIIQHDPVLAKIPVVILTAVSQDKPTSVAAFLHKPFRVKTLLDTVQRLRQQAA
jgi:CheY-like chemotaxis protein